MSEWDAWGIWVAGFRDINDINDINDITLKLEARNSKSDFDPKLGPEGHQIRNPRLETREGIKLGDGAWAWNSAGDGAYFRSDRGGEGGFERFCCSQRAAANSGNDPFMSPVGVNKSNWRRRDRGREIPKDGYGHLKAVMEALLSEVRIGGALRPRVQWSAVYFVKRHLLQREWVIRLFEFKSRSSGFRFSSPEAAVPMV